MKQLLFVPVFLLCVLSANAQVFTINNNTTCSAFKVVLRATNSSCTVDDATNVITVPASSTTSIDFSAGPYSYTVTSGTVPATLWTNGSSLNNPGFDFYEADVWNVCLASMPAYFGCNNPGDGLTVNLCGTPPPTGDFDILANCVGNTCQSCIATCIPIPCPPKVVNVNLQKIGIDWQLDIN